jgi:hypothetical protein
MVEVPKAIDREPLEKRTVSLTPSQWAWLDQVAVRNQTRSQSAELRRLIEQERSSEPAQEEEGRKAA